MQATQSFTLNSNRGILLGSATGSGGGTIDVMPGATLAYAGKIANADSAATESLTVTDSGTLALAGANTFNGGVTIQNGATVRVNPATGSLGSGGVTLNAGTLALNSSSALASSIAVAAVNPLNVIGQSSGIFVTGTSSATIAGPFSLMDSNLLVSGDTGSYTLNFTNSVTVGGGPTTFQVSNNGAQPGKLNLGPLNGSGTPEITFTGGIVTLGSSATTLPIDTTVTIGPSTTTLNLNNASALGQYAQVAVDSGSILNLGANQTVSSLSGSGTVNLNGDTLTIGNVDGASGTFSGAIGDGTGTNSSVEINGGSVELTGPNTYTGPTTITSGTLSIGNSTTPAGMNSSLNLSGGNLSLLGAGAGFNNPTQSYAYNIVQSANAGISVSGSLAATLGDLSIGADTLSVTSPSATASPYSLTFAGATGVTTLNGNPTFNVYNSAGGGAATLVLGQLNDTGVARTITFGGNGTVQLDYSAVRVGGGTKIVLSNGLAPSNAAPTSGLVDEYTFNEGSGNLVGDSGLFAAGGNFVGQGIGFTTAAKVGPYALNLTSANSFVEIPHNANLQLNTFTVSAWVNASSFSAQAATIFSTRNGADQTFDMQILPAGLHGDIGNGPGNTWLDVNLNLSYPIVTGTWYLVTYTVSSAGTTIYLNDGAARTGGATAVYTAGENVYSSGTPVLERPRAYATIGNQASGQQISASDFSSTTQFFGQIDDLRIYDTVLTQAQVAALYNLSPSGVTVNSNNSTAIGSFAQMSIGAGSTFSLGASQQVTSLSGSGSVSLGGNTLTVGFGGGDAILRARFPAQ